jgi:hypothetical protein
MTESTPDPGEAILAMARELRDVAAALGSPYLTAHVPLAHGELAALTVEDGVVTLTARGHETRLAVD